jgi:4-hydroxy-2-oxoheptanedioate aldolase
MTSDNVAFSTSAGLRSLWQRDLPTFGLWSSLPDPFTAELLATTAFDYVCVDLQHGLATFSELPSMLQAMRAAGVAPLVRVAWNEPAPIMRAFDVGASGVVVPMVNNAEEARRAAAACRFPPTGERSWGPMWAHIRGVPHAMPADQDAAAICLVMVETHEGVEALEEIVDVPGVDGVYVGPNDLALTFGYGRATYRESTEVEDLLQRIVDTCRRAGVVIGLHCSDVAMAAHWAGRGVQMLTAGQDVALLRAAAADAWAHLDEATGIASSRAGDGRSVPPA